MSHAKIGKHDDRRTRWAKHIRHRLDQILGCGWAIPPEAVKVIERKEGKPLDEIILDRLCNRRGLGVESPTLEQRRNLQTDEERETYPTRIRNNRERDEAEAEAFHFLAVDGSYYGGTEEHQIALVVERFYCRGDRTALGMATGRLIRWYAREAGVLV